MLLMRIDRVFHAYSEQIFPHLRIMRKLRFQRMMRILNYYAYYVKNTYFMRKMRMSRITGIVFYSRITAMITVRASQAQANH